MNTLTIGYYGLDVAQVQRFANKVQRNAPLAFDSVQTRKVGPKGDLTSYIVGRVVIGDVGVTYTVGDDTLEAWAQGREPRAMRANPLKPLPKAMSLERYFGREQRNKQLPNAFGLFAEFARMRGVQLKTGEIPPRNSAAYIDALIGQYMSDPAFKAAVAQFKADTKGIRRQYIKLRDAGIYPRYHVYSNKAKNWNPISGWDECYPPPSRLAHLDLLGDSTKVQKGIKKNYLTGVLYMPSSHEATPLVMQRVNAQIRRSVATGRVLQTANDEISAIMAKGEGQAFKEQNTNRINVCPFAGGCAFVCLSSSGHMTNDIPLISRFWKFALWMEKPEWALAMLLQETFTRLGRLIRGKVRVTKSVGKKRVAEMVDVSGVAIRLNGTTDIDFSAVYDYIDIATFHSVSCYDYTKNLKGFRRDQLIPTQTLTYSWSERTLAKGRPEKTLNQIVQTFRSVAVVLPEDDAKYAISQMGCEDGDATDLRFLDKDPVVILKFKWPKAGRYQLGKGQDESERARQIRDENPFLATLSDVAFLRALYAKAEVLNQSVVPEMIRNLRDLTHSPDMLEASRAVEYLGLLEKMG